MKNVLKTSSSKWLIVIIVWTFFITFFIGIFSEKISDSLPVIIAFFILFFIIGLGIFFDLLRVSGTLRSRPRFIGQPLRC